MKRYVVLILALFSLNIITFEVRAKSLLTDQQKVDLLLKYDNISGFNEGLAVVKKDGLYGYINIDDGKEVLPCVYKYAKKFSEGLAIVTNPNGENLIIDKGGNVVIQLSDNDLIGWETEFHDGMAIICSDEVWTGVYGFIDKSGRIVVPCMYYNVSPYGFTDGLAMVLNDNHKYGYIDKTGEVAIPFIYDSATAFSDGHAIVKRDNRFIIIDKNGEELVLPKEIKHVGNFSCGLAVAYYSGDRCGYIDYHGNVAVPFIYEYSFPWSFVNGYSIVSKNGKKGVIDNQGNILVDLLYDYINTFSKYGLAVAGIRDVSDDSLKYGVIDTKNNVIIPMAFDVCEINDIGLIRAKDEFGNLSIFNFKGEMLKIVASDESAEKAVAAHYAAEETNTAAPDSTKTWTGLEFMIEFAPDTLLNRIIERANCNMPIKVEDGYILTQYNIDSDFLIYEFDITGQMLSYEEMSTLLPAFKSIIKYNVKAADEDLKLVYELCERTHRGIAYRYMSSGWKDPVMISVPFSELFKKED